MIEQGEEPDMSTACAGIGWKRGITPCAAEANAALRISGFEPMRSRIALQRGRDCDGSGQPVATRSEATGNRPVRPFPHYATMT